MNLMETQQDRRRYFRIDDELTLIYREIAECDVPDANQFKHEVLDSISLSTAVEFLTQDSRVLLSKIERSQPEVAGFLKTLERKIDLIAQTILMTDRDLSDKPTKKVNISASGLSFDAEDSIDPGTIIELKMVLPPSLVAFVSYGKVVYCNTCEGKEQFSHRMGVDFLSLRDQDRELLIRYIVKRQIQQLREQKRSA